MKSINNIKAKRTIACAGSFGYDAEAEVGLENGKTVYAHVNCFDGTHYTVSETSVFDFMTDDGEDPNATFTEMYDKLSAAKESEFYPVFKVLDANVKLLIKGA